MRSPARNIAGNLMWTSTGTVWAMWRIHPLPYGYRPDKDKHQARAFHQALIRGLPGESLLLGVCAAMDPAAVVERMIQRVDLHEHPAWADECEATLDTLDSIGIGQRIYWLAKPLGDANNLDAIKEIVQSSWANFLDSLGVPRRGPSPAEVERRREQASKIAKGIPAVFHPTPATAAQMIWLDQHAQQRGLFVDSSLPDGDGGAVEELLVPRSGAALTEPLLDEGGQSDLDRKSLRTWNPATRRFLKVMQPGFHESDPLIQDLPSDTSTGPTTETAAGTEGADAGAVTGLQSSYQSMLALADVPADGMVFPGSEFLGRVDECGLEVDWAMRLTVRSSEEVAKQNRRALINLNEQFEQRDGELGGGVNTLERAAQDLAEYTKILDADKLEVEAQSTTIFAVGAHTARGAVDQARALGQYFESAGYRLTQPIGYQEDLWWAMMPGTPANRAVREFTQITTSKALSATIPFASTDLGDNAGSLLGINISTGRLGAVLHDIAGASLLDMSGSMGVAGALGSGKSVLLKTLGGGVVDRGGQIVVPDRTAKGEWAHWAQSVTEAVVVDIDEPKYSMDPLRMYGPIVGGRIAKSFLTTLLRVPPTSDLGATLSTVLKPAYLERYGLSGLGEILAHLQSADCTVEGAAGLARKMNVFTDTGFDRVIFDSSLPALQTTSPAIIIRTHTLELPTSDELLTAHLFDELRLEKVFGRAMYALIAGLARQICFSDLTRLGVFIVDEAHHLTGSPEGAREIVEFVRFGRGHLAAVLLGSHDPEADFGSDTLRGLIPTRIQMKQTDKNLARKGLRWLDMDPDDEALLDMLINDTSPSGPHGVEEHRRGEAFMRDAHGNIGRIKVLAPSVPSRNEAVRSTPGGEQGAEATSPAFLPYSPSSLTPPSEEVA